MSLLSEFVMHPHQTSKAKLGEERKGKTRREEKRRKKNLLTQSVG